MEKRVVFSSKLLPYLLVAPQMIIVFIFFFWPASQAIILSFFREDAFGLSSKFVGFTNYAAIFTDKIYLKSISVTLYFSLSVTFLTMFTALFLAMLADRVVRGGVIYKTLVIWPYAVAPVVAGVLWLFMFNPTIGVVSYLIKSLGFGWNHTLNGGQAFFLVVIASSWKQISYNFLFFIAGLQSIPPSLVEAAAIDGASVFGRFRKIIFPLLTPTTFFLIVMNMIYSFFETFGVIHQVTEGGPNQATNILVYKVFHDGFLGLDLGGSSAQSVILMIFVIILAVFQFRFLENKVKY